MASLQSIRRKGRLVPVKVKRALQHRAEFAAPVRPGGLDLEANSVQSADRAVGHLST